MEIREDINPAHGTDGMPAAPAPTPYPSSPAFEARYGAACETQTAPGREADPPQRPSDLLAKGACTLPTNWSLVVLFFVVVLITVFSVLQNSFDNDMWWLLATGREIVENGYPATNPWSLHEGMGIVLQQWLAAVILYVIYDTFGLWGLKVFVFLQCLVLAAVLYGLCRIVSGRRHGSGEVFALAIAVAFISLSAYISVRPHLYSMTLFALVIAVMELYRQQQRPTWLALLPLLTLIHVNVHAAMAPFDLFIIALYLIPDVPAFLRRCKIDLGAGFYRMDYRRLPVLVALVVAAAAMLINPAGIRGPLYLVLSYGAADYSNYINEMGSTGFWTDYGGATMAMIVLGAIAIGRNGGRRIDVPLTVLFIVCIPLSMMHTRNVWLVALFAVPLFARSFSHVRVNTRRIRLFSNRAFNGAVAALLICVGLGNAVVTQWPTSIDDAEMDCSSVPSGGMDYLDNFVAERGLEKTDLRIYNSFNNGGYLEWRGYKVTMDPRPELWEPGITGIDRHYYQEFVDFAQGHSSISDYVNEYNFDFLIAYTSSDLNSWLRKSDSYELAYTGSGYQIWARNGILADGDADENTEANSTSATTGTALTEEITSLSNSVSDH